MTTEQMDTTDARRKRDAVAEPEILYGTPTHEELIEARKLAGRRGVLIVPESMRDALIASGGGWRSEHPVTDQEPHEHYSNWANRVCAAGDHEGAESLDRDAERVKVREAEKAEQDRIEREDGVVDITRHTEDTLFKVAQALRETGHTEADASNTITAILNAGILFREPAPDYDAVRESTEAHIREVYDLEESDMATMAEEPIENRLRRAWLNGFKEGVERASYSATESWGRWDS